jgi:hypothetical protein
MSDYNVAEYSEDALPNQVSPEGAVVANAYLRNACSVIMTAEELDIPTHEVSAQLHQPLVKQYVTSILRENGYRHMEVIASKLDNLIEKKWEELEEAEIGSNKDIAELLSLAHKMRMDMSNLLQKDTIKQPVHQSNTQINNFGEGNYGKLMEKLIKA